MLLKILRSAFSRLPRADTFVNRSLELRKQGRQQEAEQVLREAATQFPRNAIVATNLGVAMLEQNQAEHGVSWLQRAIEYDPRCAPAHYNLANVMRASGQRGMAIEHYEAAIDAEPAFGHAREELMNCLLEVCDWERAERIANDIRATIAREPAAEWMRYVSPLTALHLGLPAADVKAISAYHAAELARGVNPAARRENLTTGESGVRLRIGYLSRDFGNHPVGQLLANAFALHDRARFECYAFSFGRDDGSDYRHAIATGVDHFIDAQAMTDDELARAIADAGIHVLIDLAGHTTGNRMAVLARRPAPVQAHYLGFAATTGAPYIDYYITDAVATPASMADAFSETLAYVPHCFMISDGTDALDPAAEARQAAAIQLPSDAIVFCNFNNGSRITREDFGAWLQILGGVPGSVLWLQGANPLMVENLRAIVRASGIEQSRIIFAQRVPSKREHLSRLSRADLMLDTISWHTGHSSTSDALWAGVPVMTVPGQQFANRVAASLATAAGLPQFVRRDRDDYIETAIRMARERIELAAAKRQLAERTAPFFDTRARVRDLEAAYLEMWEKSGNHTRVAA